MEYFLAFIIVAQLGALIYQQRRSEKERKSLTDAIVAKNNQELVNLRLAENTKVEAPEKTNEPPTWVEPSAVPDDEYVKMITEDLNG